MMTLCWCSDGFQPLIVPDPLSSTVWIGVDERIVCLSCEGSTRFSIGLSSQIVRILLFERCVVVLCETQALAINPDFSLRRIAPLREIPDNADMKGDTLIVTFIDGESETISI